MSGAGKAHPAACRQVRLRNGPNLNLLATAEARSPGYALHT
jgi:hypothetical protein